MHDDYVIASLEKLVHEGAAYKERSANHECARHSGSFRVSRNRTIRRAVTHPAPDSPCLPDGGRPTLRNRADFRKLAEVP
jgi:hypothetical protein